MNDGVEKTGLPLPMLELVADTLPYALVVLARDGRVALANGRTYTVLGLSPDAPLDGQHMWQSFPPELRDSFAAMQREVVIYGTDVQRDVTFQSGNGEPVLLEVTLAAVPTNEACPEYYTLTIAEAKDRQETERLKKLDQLKINFLAMISHELRTPLTSIRGAIHLLGKCDALQSESDQALVQIVGNNSERLIVLVNNLLEMVAIENRTFTVSRMPTSVNDAIHQAMVKCEKAAGDKFISIAVDGNPMVAQVDPERMAQLVTYLLDNAIKFTPHGGQVSVRYDRTDDGELHLTVSDMGCGVPAHARERIFDKFYQVEDPMTRGCAGAGIGLYLARTIAEYHGGRMWVESNSAGGSDFRAVFPGAVSATVSADNTFQI